MYNLLSLALEKVYTLLKHTNESPIRLHQLIAHLLFHPFSFFCLLNRHGLLQLSKFTQIVTHHLCDFYYTVPIISCQFINRNASFGQQKGLTSRTLSLYLMTESHFSSLLYILHIKHGDFAHIAPACHPASNRPSPSVAAVNTGNRAPQHLMSADAHGVPGYIISVCADTVCHAL